MIAAEFKILKFFFLSGKGSAFLAVATPCEIKMELKI